MTPHEEYTFVLKHEYIDENGGKHRLDEPLIVRQVFIHSDPRMPTNVLINKLFYMARERMIKCLSDEECEVTE